MPRKFFDLNRPDEVKHVGPMAVMLYEYEKDGRDQTAVLLHRPLPHEDGSREMLCDLDRLEAALKRGKELFAPFADVREPMEKVVGSISFATWNVRYVVRADVDRPAEMVVAIDQDHPKGRQLLGCRLDEFEEAVKNARDFERGRGHEPPPLYQVVRCVGLEQDDSIARLHVERTLPRGDAERYAAENWRDYGTVVYEQPIRRKFGEDGGNYEFTPTVEDALGFAPKLRTEIDYIKVERERRTPEMVVGLWYDHGIEPLPGTPVKVDAFGRDPASREARPYRVTRADGDKPRGPGESPIPVIVKLDKGFPPIHKIERALTPESHKPDSPDDTPPPGGISKANTAAFQQVVRVHREEHAERLKLIQERTQEAIDLGRESFSPGHRPKL